MELMEAITKRHSVRSYSDRKIEGAAKEELLSFIRQCNEESGLHMQLVLNTCWVALTYSKIKSEYEIHSDEKLYLVIAVGYGQTQGTAHKSKDIDRIMQGDQPFPEWFKKGVQAALLAPTAMNQQKFVFVLNGNTVLAKCGRGFYTKIDLGIAKYHFEIGAGKESFNWAAQ